MQTPNAQAPLCKLPKEIFSQIADHLDQPSLKAFRASAKFVESSNFDDFTDRLFKPLTVDITARQIQQAINLIQSTDAGNKIDSIVFIDDDSYQSVDATEYTSSALTIFRSLDWYGDEQEPPIVDTQEHDAVELYTKLSHLFSLVPNLNQVKLKARDDNHPYMRHQRPTTAISQLLQVLGETTARLTSLELIWASSSADVLIAAITQHKPTLQCLRLNSWSCIQGNWQDVFEHIRDHLSLDRLRVDALSILPDGHKFYFYLQKTSKWRLSGATRDTDTKKIQHFTMGRSSAFFEGGNAVKRGIGIMLPHFGVSEASMSDL